MRNFKLVLAYDGSEFHGWQVQPGLATVQGTLAEALARITGERVLPQGSGRTDAGVHALAQVASCALASPIPATNLHTALNDVLPPAVRVLEVAEAAADFHARHSARAKTYRYRIHRGAICPPFLARYVYHHPYPLDEPAMLHAANLVEGTHDFTSFAAVDPERSRDREPGDREKDKEEGRESREEEAPGNQRTIFSSAWERQGEELPYTVRGSGFLHHMVRNLVGTFLLIGKGTLDEPGLRRILELKDRSAAGATAPATGLYLMEVEY
jgi:tRNA pseudouridine38-40 synthase